MTIGDHHENSTAETYRAVSGLAVLSAILGIASALALIHPLLWIIPLVTLILSGVALRRMAGDPELIGRKAILVGLACACFFGTLAPARLLARDWLLSSQARRIAGDWLELILDSRLQEAHQWTLDPAQRHLSATTLQEYYQGDAEALSELKKFASQNTVDRLREWSKHAKIRFDRRQELTSESRTDFVVHQFIIDSAAEGTESPWKIQVFLKRSIHPSTGKAFWVVQKMQEFET